MSREISVEAAEPFLSRRANDYLVDAKHFRPPAMLFDAFWREGEVALFFGGAGTGKSILATQVADALARGRPLHGFQMPRRWRKVLYVDLDLTDAQFRSRYSPYRFAANLFRDRPPQIEETAGWIREVAVANGIREVIVDSLSALKATHDGIRETLLFMRRMKLLAQETGIAVLVVADAAAPRDGWLSEDDLKRSRVLATVADSVFGVARGKRRPGGTYIQQIRSKGAKMVWTDRTAPRGDIKRRGDGLLVFEFDERFTAKIDDETRELMTRLTAKRERGETFRTIAGALGISRSYAQKLYQKWQPAIMSGEFDEEEDSRPLAVGGRQLTEDDDEFIPDADRYGIPQSLLGGTSRQLAVGGRQMADEVGESTGIYRHMSRARLQAIPFAAGLGRRLIYDLEPGYDAMGRAIYIETREERTRKPLVWYKQDRQKRWTRHERKGNGIQVETLGENEYI